MNLANLLLSRAAAAPCVSKRKDRRVHRYGPACAGVVVAMLAAAAIAQSRPVDVAPAGGGKIVLGRSIANVDGTLRSSSLFRINADGTLLEPLTPPANGVFHGSPSWAPRGGRLAFTRVAGGKSDIHVMDSHGIGSRQVTAGPQDFVIPTWGPGGVIAFATRMPYAAGVTRDCLSVVQADGSQQRNLFCPPVESSRGNTMQALSWSPDGALVFFEVGYVGLTSDTWFSSMYLVDVRSGVEARLVDQFELWDARRPDVSFARDGSNAILGDRARGVLRIDFASGDVTLLAEGGFAPLYSDDNSKIAFTRRLVDGDVAYEQLFVMDADGGNIRPMTTARVDGLEYRAADWSRDGARVLVNRTLQTETATGGRIRRGALRIIDTRTRAITAVGAGYTYRDGWYEPRVRPARAAGD